MRGQKYDNEGCKKYSFGAKQKFYLLYGVWTISLLYYTLNNWTKPWARPFEDILTPEQKGYC